MKDCETSATDLELFRRISCGDENAFRNLFTAQVPKFEAFLNTILKNELLVKDCIQEVFLALWVRRSELDGVQNPAAYLRRMVANAAVNQFRERDRYQHLVNNLQDEGGHSGRPLPAAEKIAVRELQERIRNIVSRLPEQRRIVFLLSKEKGFSRARIAEKMRLSKKTVSNHLSYALAALREALQYD